ncbi:lactonase family protein [Seonamhaeicola sp. NFXS20]|uniref:lactonase family protein n=1 Tax=Seonamhaeicola sp. NFXS20 TaxID=2816959 RepID=UPI003B8DB66B
MKFKFSFFIIAISILNFNCKSSTSPLFVGTFTDKDSKGIYRFDFNTKTGELNNKILSIEAVSPSFLDYSPDKKFIYSVNKTGTENDYISSYRINPNGTLSLINSVSSNGKNPCHISINKTGNKAVVSMYTAGKVSVYNINTDGSLNQASQVFNHNTENEKAKAHSAQFYKDDLFVADLGRNAVYQYKLKDDNYNLQSEAIVKMKGNPGPRHFSITKNGQFIYIINEYGSSITSVKRTESSFKIIDEDSTLDENYLGKNSCADIHLSKNEQFLYGSNRGENSIAVFKRNTKDGTIEKIQNISVHGNWPRNFTLDPTGKFLLVANRRSNNISVFSINELNGKLTFLHDVKTPTPVCLLF